MGTRHPNPGLVKIHRSYTVDEVGRCLDTHRNTVRSWLRQGLPKIDDRRPILIRGADLRAFLTQRRKAAKVTCPPGHIYCFRCRAPRQPAEKMADYVGRPGKPGDLTAICPNCTGLMKRKTSEAQIDALRSILDITITRPA